MIPATRHTPGDTSPDSETRSVQLGHKWPSPGPDVAQRWARYGSPGQMRNAGRVVTRTMLLESIWEFHFDPKTNIVETHMSRLRGKVDRGQPQELIHTVRGAGYCLREPD